MFWKRLWIAIKSLFVNNGTMRKDLERLRDRLHTHATAQMEWCEELGVYADEILAESTAAHEESDKAKYLASQINGVL
jgi:hypothetical protein